MSISGWRRVLGLAALMAATAMADLAHADFGAVIRISAPSACPAEMISPQVATNAAGDATFIWICGLDIWHPAWIQTRTMTAEGVLGKIQNLTDPNQQTAKLDDQVMVNANGDAVYTWVSFGATESRVQARMRSAAGVLGPIRNISKADQNAQNPQVAIDSNGNAVFAWEIYDGTSSHIEARSLSAAGVLGKTFRVANSVDLSGVAVDGNGSAVFAWQFYDSTRGYVRARKLTADGVLGPIQNIAKVPPGSAGVHSPLVDANGNTVIAWDVSYSSSTTAIHARTLSAAGVLGPIQDISDPSEHSLMDTAHGAAIDANGDVVFVWLARGNSAPRVQARALSAAGVLSAIQTIAAGGSIYSYVPARVGVDANGNAVFVWNYYRSPIQACTRSVTGTLGPIQTILNSNPTLGFAGSPQISVAANGHAVAVWQSLRGIKATVGP